MPTLKKLISSFCKKHDTTLPWAARAAADLGWNVHLSEPPPYNARDTPKQGGRAVLWKKTLNIGKSCMLPLQSRGIHSHRNCQITFPHLSIMSAYGPAKACDRKWFSEVMFDSHASQKLCQMVIGDFNWGNPYDHLIPESWNMATPKTTTHSGTVPTRALCTHPVQQVQVTPLPGIPSYLAVLYKVRSPLASERPETHRMRPRRCASFSWNATSGISNAQLDHIISEVNYACPHLDASHSLVDRWRQWHSRVNLKSLSEMDMLKKHPRPNGHKDRYPLLDPVIHSLLTDLGKVCFTVGCLGCTGLLLNLVGRVFTTTCMCQVT